MRSLLKAPKALTLLDLFCSSRGLVTAETSFARNHGSPRAQQILVAVVEQGYEGLVMPEAQQLCCPGLHTLDAFAPACGLTEKFAAIGLTSFSKSPNDILISSVCVPALKAICSSSLSR